MVSTEQKAQRRRPRWTAIGLLVLSLGMAAIVVGVPWTWLSEGNWPWSNTVSQTPSGVEVTVTHPDGRNEVFRAATRQEADTWMERRNEDLKRTYHLNERIAAGRVMGPVGSGLVVIGGGILVWRTVRAVGRKRVPGV